MRHTQGVNTRRGTLEIAVLLVLLTLLALMLFFIIANPDLVVEVNTVV